MTNNVFIVNEQNEVESIPVTLGIETPNQYEVIAGLKEGQLVVTGRFADVHAGQKVETRVVGPLAKE